MLPKDKDQEEILAFVTGQPQIAKHITGRVEKVFWVPRTNSSTSSWPMLKVLYDIGVLLLGLAWSPKLFQDKYKSSIRKRLGLEIPEISSKEPRHLDPFRVDGGDQSRSSP